MTRKFKVGDKVKFVHNNTNSKWDDHWWNSRGFPDCEGVITHVYPNENAQISIYKKSNNFSYDSTCVTCCPHHIELVTPDKPEVWIVSTLGGQVIDKHFFNEADAREAANRFTQSCPKHKFYISKAVGYVESVPQPTTRYVEL